MNALALSVLVALALALPAGAQGPNTPPPTTPIPNGLATWKANEYPVTVTGCIRGKNIVVANIDGEGSLFATLRASEFVLQGRGELMRQIKNAHDGHYDRIEGIVVVPAAPTSASSTVTTKKFGKTDVTLAGHRQEDKTDVQDAPRPLTLKVESLTHLQKGCAGH
jgi:hypothetical protein